MDSWHNPGTEELPEIRMEKLEGFGFQRQG